MYVEVYDGDELAAIFRFGTNPEYRGVAGSHVKQLVSRPHWQHNPHTGELKHAGLLDHTPEWQEASVCGALYQTRYRVVSAGIEPAEETEGVP